MAWTDVGAHFGIVVVAFVCDHVVEEKNVASYVVNVSNDSSTEGGDESWVFCFEKW